MASSPFLHLLLFFLLFSFASSTTLSNDIFESQGLPGRTLLQQKEACSGIDFENLNYTIITSQCKGPNYQAKACCGSFKELACPYSDELNDVKNDCATTMFSYINLYGKYPPGLFANLCHDDKQGLNCDQVMEEKSKEQKSSSAVAADKSTHFLVLMISTASFLALLFNLF